MSRDSMTNTFLVATALCVVCSILVSSAAVGLRERQLCDGLAKPACHFLGFELLLSVIGGGCGLWRALELHQLAHSRASEVTSHRIRHDREHPRV